MPDIIIELDRHDEISNERPANVRRGNRPLLIAALVALILSTSGGLETVPPTNVRQIAQMQVDKGASLDFVDGNLLVAEPGWITAFDITTGLSRWRLDSGLANVWFRHYPGLLIAYGSRLGSHHDEPIETLAIDSMSGALRWRLPGTIDFIGDLLVSTAGGGWDITPRIAIYDQRAVALWSVPSGPNLVAVMGERDRLAAVDSTTGWYRELDLKTGTVLREAVLPGAITARQIWFTGKHLLVSFAGGHAIEFDPVTLTPRPSAPALVSFPRQDCGDLWCERMRDGSLWLLDKATGARLHTPVRWDVAHPVGNGLLGLGRWSEGGLVAARGFYDIQSRAEMDLSGWEALNVSRPNETSSAGNPVYLKGGKEAVHYFASLDDRGFRVIGVVPSQTFRTCMAQGEYLACLTETDLIRIWRLT